MSGLILLTLTAVTMWSWVRSDLIRYLSTLDLEGSDLG